MGMEAGTMALLFGALAQDQLPVPELPASCETSLALAQASATGR